MIFDQKAFYQSYQKDYHEIKAKYIKKQFDRLEAKKVKKTLSKREVEMRRTLQIDLRQTYFHAIETFFELFFALNPKGKKSLEDEKILFNLSNSNWNKTFDRIKKIAENENELDFLKEKLVINEKEVTIGQYLFYCGIFSNKNFRKELFERMEKSIDAITYGMKIIAKDFVKREEYNAYKHGIRAIPSITKMKLTDAETQTKSIEFSIEDSLSFYLKSKNPKELITITKVLDTKRDFYLTLLCSEFIHHLIYFRRFAVKAEGYKQEEKVAITFFGKDIIKKSAESNVELTELTHTIKEVEK